MDLFGACRYSNALRYEPNDLPTAAFVDSEASRIAMRVSRLFTLVFLADPSFRPNFAFCVFFHGTSLPYVVSVSFIKRFWSSDGMQGRRLRSMRNLNSIAWRGGKKNADENEFPLDFGCLEEQRRILSSWLMAWT